MSPEGLSSTPEEVKLQQAKSQETKGFIDKKDPREFLRLLTPYIQSTRAKQERSLALLVKIFNQDPQKFEEDISENLLAFKASYLITNKEKVNQAKAFFKNLRKELVKKYEKKEIKKEDVQTIFPWLAEKRAWPSGGKKELEYRAGINLALDRRFQKRVGELSRHSEKTIAGQAKSLKKQMADIRVYNEFLRILQGSERFEKKKKKSPQAKQPEKA